MSAQDSAAQTVLELIAFRIGEQEFCVDIMTVREIRGWTPATPLPMTPPYVRGVINLRGTVLPIIDLACRLGLPPVQAEARSVIIVVNFGDRLVGLLVDAVSDILTTPASAVQPTPDMASGAVRSFIRGLISLDQRLISQIALERVLEDAEPLAA